MKELDFYLHHKHPTIKKQAERLVGIKHLLSTGKLSVDEFKELSHDIITTLDTIKQSQNLENKIQFDKFIKIVVSIFKTTAL